MKRFLFTVCVLIAIAGPSGAQTQTAAEIRQAAQQQLTQSRANSTQYSSVLADLNARNSSNTYAVTFQLLRSEITRLEASIDSEQTRIRNSLDGGNRVSPEMFNRVQRLIDRHGARLADLEAFVAQ
jgi:DNA anti-recombination protein RmuC